MNNISEDQRPNALSSLTALGEKSSWQQVQWRHFKALGLPTAKDEDWKYTSLEGFLNLPLRSPSRDDIHTVSIESLTIGFDCYRIVLFNGQLIREMSDPIPGVNVDNIDHISDAKQQLLNAAVKPEAFSLLTDATATSGLFIEVAKKQRIDKPIYLFHINSGEHGDLCSYRHHITVGDQAECSVFEHHTSLAQGGGVTCARLTASVGANAQFNHLKLIEESHQQHHFGHNDIVLSRDAQASSHTFLLEGQVNRHHTSAVLAGTGSHIEMNSLSLPTSGQTFDTRTYLDHHSAHCTSEQAHKVIGKGDSTAVFNGMIYVHKGAIKTDGQMDNHNLLLDDKAQVNSKPQLEIYADDVKCSHGATTGQLDKNQLFYLQARGIPKQLAEKMVTFAFAGELTDAIDDLNVREHIVRRIEQKIESER
ncbi:Fe-S cluster assembly protein SufD [Thaumasiovibrio subtropicus]|uniref:Fe-S cluster assembly protein SufD n=1 Tax=Thaumasiovibrio subtropicus TaxID=1891207 RepID=UPI000B35F9B3|nr:Fe-S cluster assembly protein SufD [Thaumasiovibrio subtropicus]